MRRVEIAPGDEFDKVRIDKVLAATMPEFSRSHIQRLIADGRVQVGGEVVTKPSAPFTAGRQLVVSPPADAHDATPRAQDIDLDIIHEDDDLVALNKPAGLVVHGGAGHHDETLVNALLHRYGDTLSHIGGIERPGIVHRLDKGTSGVMVVARNDAAHEALAAQFRDRTTRKEYVAITYGCPRTASGAIDLPIGRDRKDRTKVSAHTDRPRAALSQWEVAEDLNGLSVLRVFPKTGRMHQVRVHLASIHHPCIGDLKYGGSRWKDLADGHTRAIARAFPRPALHALHLALAHPQSGEPMTFSAPLAADLETLLAALRSAGNGAC